MMLLLVCNAVKAEEAKRVKEISSSKVGEIDIPAIGEVQKAERAESKKSQERPKLTFLPKTDEYVKYISTHNTDKTIKLKEFKVGKKYCLWGAKKWDDKCQDAAMEYAFGENWTEFKKVALDFVEYTREMDVEKLVALFTFDYTLYIHFPKLNANNNYIPGNGFMNIPGRSIYTAEGCRRQLTKKIMQDWNKALKGTKYKDFLIVSRQSSRNPYVLELSRYMTILFARGFNSTHDSPIIYEIEYY
jgi:hypothetical protein